MKIAAENWKKVTYPMRFRNLNSSYTRISTHIDVDELTEDQKTTTGFS